MTTRILPVEEWSKLVGTEAAQLWPHLSPERSKVVVVEDGLEIVGCWVLLNVLHAECLWIAPAHRGHGSVARRLWKIMRDTAESMGFPVVATAAMSDDVRGLLDHIGANKMQGDHYLMKVH